MRITGYPVFLNMGRRLTRKQYSLVVVTVEKHLWNLEQPATARVDFGMAGFSILTLSLALQTKKKTYEYHR